MRLTELLSAASDRASEKEGGREGEQKHLGLDGGSTRGRQTEGRTERGERKLLLLLLWLLPPSLHLLSEGSPAQLARSLSPSLHSLLGSHSLSLAPSLQMLLVEGNRPSSLPPPLSFLPSFVLTGSLARSQVSSRAECFLRDTDIVTACAEAARSKRPAHK